MLILQYNKRPTMSIFNIYKKCRGNNMSYQLFFQEQTEEEYLRRSSVLANKYSYQNLIGFKEKSEKYLHLIRNFVAILQEVALFISFSKNCFWDYSAPMSVLFKNCISFFIKFYGVLEKRTEESLLVRIRACELKAIDLYGEYK